MNPTPTHWTDDRIAELKQLRSLLSECGSLNNGSGVIQRMERIIELAKILTETGEDFTRVDFMRFLTERAREDRFPTISA